jgi:hypothetical protein
MVLLHKLQVVFTLLELNGLRQFKTLELIDRQATPSLKDSVLIKQFHICLQHGGKL